MSRSKGYKCFNIKCGSCIGKTLCGEPEDTALVCVDRVVGKPMANADRIRAMSDKELAEFLSGIEYGRGTPWSEPFARRLCDSCPTVHGTYESGVEDDFHECDFVDGKCPNGSAIMWWLQQPAEEDKHETGRC